MGLLSGKFVIRMPEHLHRWLKDEALRTGVSLNRLCVTKLQANAKSSDKAPLHAGFFPKDLIDKIIQRWQEELLGLVFFGSAARGEATDDSDIDLLLIMKPGVRIARDLYRHWDEFEGIQDSNRISPHFVSLPGSIQEAGGLWYETALDGLVLWERDHHVTRFLRALREAMSRGEIQRRTLHGSPYWIKESKERNAQ